MTPWEWHAALFERARSKGIDIFSSPFDESAVDFLEQLNVSCYKIASFENNHFPLLRKVAQTGKPVILSTGASTLDEITRAVKTLRENGCTDLTLLKCTSTYPAKASNSNLLTIPVLKELFQCQVGLSDHTGGVGVAVAAVALGAVVIEKHFTLDRSEGGVDAAFSLEPHELKLLVEETTRAHEALGSVFFGILPEELKSLQYKRSIYAVKDIAEGEELTTENMRIIRPGGGLSPAHWETALGSSAAQALQRGEPVTWSAILKR
jgi:pseudaminic acid synthase